MSEEHEVEERSDNRRGGRLEFIPAQKPKPGEEDTPERAYKIFGRGLYKLMSGKGWHQADFARASGVSDDAISRYIRGRSLPTRDSAKLLADALGMSVQQLMIACDGESDPDIFALPPVPPPPVADPDRVRWAYDAYIPFDIAQKLTAVLRQAQQAGLLSPATNGEEVPQAAAA
jgi:transcriptional regulator with XRE-family HTH domain